MRVTLKCDCCSGTHKEGMAYLEKGKLIIVRESHGRRHTLTLPIDNWQALVQFSPQQVVPTA